MLRFDKPYSYVAPTLEVNDEGSRFHGFEGPKIPVNMTVYPASSKRMLEVYGARVVSMLRALTLSKDVMIGCGVCIDADRPDYKVVGRQVYTTHVELDLEAM